MQNNHHQPILIVGAGNMGKSIAKGLLTKLWSPRVITLCDYQPSRHASLHSEFPGCNVISEPSDIESAPKVILLAVKPKSMASVCQSLAAHSQFDNCLFITVAAGIPVRVYMRWLGAASSIVRCMPNTPAEIGAGMTGLFTTRDTTAEHRSLAENIMKTIGQTLWLQDESLLDSLTAVSGSGPAYLFYFMECLQNSAQALGLSKEDSYQLTLQTVLGAAQLAAHQNTAFEKLRENVTSKGGTTEQAITHLIACHLDATIEQAVRAAANRAHEISQSFDKE